jgi:AcrR family transcriptional regulator
VGRPLQIDRESVLEAGLAIADRDGLDAVTMQSVANDLGVTPMALYRHIENKADLLDGLVELLLTDMPLPPETMAWRQRLRWMAEAVRGAADCHPGVFGLLLQRPAATPGARQVRDQIYQALREGRVSEADIPRVERVISTVILGFAASEAGGRFGSRSKHEIDEDFAAAELMIEGYLDDLARTAGRSSPPATSHDVRTGSTA